MTRDVASSPTMSAVVLDDEPTRERMRWRRLLQGCRGVALIPIVIAGGLVVGALGDPDLENDAELHLFENLEDHTRLLQSSRTESFVSTNDTGRRVQITFTIVNHEGHVVDYPYVARLVDGRGARITSATGAVTVDDHSSATETVALWVTPDDVSWSAVEIGLTGRGERLRLPRIGLEAEGM